LSCICFSKVFCPIFSSIAHWLAESGFAPEQTKKETNMKNQCIVTILGGMMLLATAGTASAAAEVLPPSSLPYGYSYEEWSAKWWQFYYNQSTKNTPVIGSPDICEGEASRVLFLDGEPTSTTATHHVTIRSYNPLFFAILGFEADNTSCPLDTFGTNSAATLESEVVGGFNSLVTSTTCTIDGVEVAGLEDPTNSIYDVVSPAFSYTTAKKDNIPAVAEGEPCLPGELTVYPTVADGIYLMVSPFSPGRHTIHFVAVAGPVSSPVVKYDITYDFTVLP
jgi:hypothetical protein